MDSLTHIVLGAAIGEVVLGKKIGNRALIWGAIGETIPDLDVLGNFFLSPTEALAFHRGITHSILFAVIAPLIFGGLVYKLYHSERHKGWPYKILISVINVALIISLIFLFNYLFSVNHHPRWWLLVLTIGLGAYLGWRLYTYYLQKDLESPKESFGKWYLLFFLTFITHILLDSCTTFGTQLFLPFTNYRVAFNNIAVADPAYTIPFLICTIIFSMLRRNTTRRTFFAWLGIGISSAYMLFTVINKLNVDSVFEKALAHRQIEATRWRTSPTILNNVLWTCVAEDPKQYYVGQYSIFDSDPNLHYINVIPKNDSLHQVYSSYPDYATLRWFSDGYLAIYQSDTATVLTDLRYGGMTDTLTDYHDMVFNFKVEEGKDGPTFVEYRQPLPGNFWEVLGRFILRMEGY